MHPNSMPTFITNHPFMFHAKIIPNSSIPAHKPFNTCKIAYFIWQSFKNRGKNRTCVHSRPVLAQAERPRSGELLSPRRELEKWNSGVVAFSRLGETSSPEWDGFLLKTGARRLSDNSRNTCEGFWYSRLSETHSIRRDYQISSTVHPG